MFSFTAQNVYKGNAAMLNLYSGLDRGNEDDRRRRQSAAAERDGQLGGAISITTST